MTPLRIVCCTSVVAVGSAFAQAPAQVGLDEQDCRNALQLVTEGKYPEAIKLYEGVPQKYPTSGWIPESKFRLGYVYMLTGQFDKARTALEGAIAAKNVTPEIVELSYSLFPQIAVAKAAKLEQNDPKRKEAFQAAVKEFDTFIQRYPQSEEVESANYGKARALFSIEQYEDAAKALEINVQKFQNSPSVLDSEFLLALSLGTQANTLMKSNGGGAAANAAYDKATRYFADIISKRTDLALSNEAQFQFGEMLCIRANFETSPETKEKYFKLALAAYRAVLSKDMVIKAQQDRIDYIKAALAKPMDPIQAKRLQRFLQKEQEKAGMLKDRPDQTVPAKLKCAQIYVTLQRFNEARVILRYIEPLATENDQKKLVLYFMTVTYAGQENIKESVEYYDKFFAAYKADPLGENLPVLLASAFTAKGQQEKAQKYYDEQRSMYPNSPLLGDATMRKGLSMIPLGKYDEALEILNKFLAGSPTPEQGASATMGVAQIYQKTNKREEALKAYTTLRDTYKGSPEAEQAGFWVGQIAHSMGDQKKAVAEFKTFLERNPKSELVPPAILTLGQAQAASGETEDAIASFKKVAAEYPKSDAGPASYFQLSAIYYKAKELDKVKQVMKEFVEKYPDNERVFDSYDYIAQIQMSQKAPQDAAATYEEFLATRPTHEQAPKALIRISNAWKKKADDLPMYNLLKDDQKAEWRKAVDSSIAAAEKVLEKFPKSDEVSLALQNLMACQVHLVRSKLKTEKDLDEYFNAFSLKFEGKSETKNKILFTLAGHAAEKDESKAFGIMRNAYDEKLKYAPADLDLYGAALLKNKQIDAAQKVFEKLGNDYPLPANTAPEKAPKLISDAQSISLYGEARVLQAQGKKKESAQKFEQLKTTYPSSSKLLEAEYGIAEGEAADNKYDDALTRLQKVAANGQAPTNLRARSMILMGEILEKKSEAAKVAAKAAADPKEAAVKAKEARDSFDNAINNYIKVGSMFQAETELAPEGLLRGAQLLEKKLNQ